MRLFISYAHQDKDTVRQLAEILRKDGYDPEFNEELKAGLPWQEQLREVIQRCHTFVYALTPASVASEWCQWEFVTAIELGKPIIPVLLEKAELPVILSRYRYADFTAGFNDEARVQRFLADLYYADIIVTIAPEDVPAAPCEPRGEPSRAPTIEQRGSVSAVSSGQGQISQIGQRIAGEKARVWRILGIRGLIRTALDVMVGIVAAVPQRRPALFSRHVSPISRIFISYRRADSDDEAKSIYANLVAAFGEAAAFMDIDKIYLGENFQAKIEEEIINCDVVLVIIGPAWTMITDENNHRRLHNPDDFVRREVEFGLRHKKRVIPVLVNNATMPTTADLPASLYELSFLNAIALAGEEGMASLVEHLRKELDAIEAKRRPLWQQLVSTPYVRFAAGILALVVMTLIIWFILSNRPYPPPIALLDDQIGIVQMLVDRGETKMELPNGERVTVRDKTELLENSELLMDESILRMVFQGGALAVVHPLTIVKLVQISDTSQRLEFEVSRGRLDVTTGGFAGVVIEPPESTFLVIEVRGSNVSVEANPDDETTQFACLTGDCTIWDPFGNILLLPAGKRISLTGFGESLNDTEITPITSIPQAEIDAFNELCGGCIDGLEALPPETVTAEVIPPYTTFDCSFIDDRGMPVAGVARAGQPLVMVMGNWFNTADEAWEAFQNLSPTLSIDGETAQLWSADRPKQSSLTPGRYEGNPIDPDNVFMIGWAWVVTELEAGVHTVVLDWNVPDRSPERCRLTVE